MTLPEEIRLADALEKVLGLRVRVEELEAELRTKVTWVPEGYVDGLKADLEQAEAKRDEESVARIVANKRISELEAENEKNYRKWQDEILRRAVAEGRAEHAEAELAALKRVAESALAIQDKVAAQQDFTRHLSELAAEARRTGTSQTHRIVEQPHVHDYGDVIAALCEQLDRWSKTRKRGRP